MPTLEDLLRVASADLHWAADSDASLYGSRAVTGVWLADAGRPGRGWPGTIAVLSAETLTSEARTANTLGWLARAEAAAVLTGDPAPEWLRAAAHRHRLPLLLTTTPGHPAWLRLALLIGDRRHAEERDGSRRTQQLLAHTRRLGADTATAAHIIRWLGVATDGGQAVLLDPHRPAPATIGGPPWPADEVALLARRPGPAAAVARETDGWSMRMYALGPAAPRHVLAVARRGGWTPAVRDAVRDAKLLLDSWMGMREIGEATAEGCRDGLLQLLMDGRIFTARRLAARLGIARLLLEAETVRVHVVSGDPSRRIVLAAALHHRLGDRALVVRCPVDSAQTIIAAIDRDAVTSEIRETMAFYPGHADAVGTSLPAAPAALAEGHGQATRALAVAPTRPDSMATYTAEPDLADVVPALPAWRWQHDLLAPIAPTTGGTWTSDDRADLLRTVGMCFAYGPHGAANLIGGGRNTPRDKARHLGARLGGLDPTHSLATKIMIDLALRLDGQQRHGTPPPGPRPCLRSLLETPEVAAWGENFLARLNDTLAQTVITWITHGQVAAETCLALNISPRTFTARIRRAEAALHRPLIGNPHPGTPVEAANGVSGVHDVVVALHATGRLTSILANCNRIETELHARRRQTARKHPVPA